jgi:DNA sulfur modification protein DndB
MKFDHLDVFPALRGVVGKWVFYSTVMTADQIARRVSTAKSIRETKSLDDHLQRELKNNVSKICKYLLGNEWRKGFRIWVMTH